MTNTISRVLFGSIVGAMVSAVLLWIERVHKVAAVESLFFYLAAPPDYLFGLSTHAGHFIGIPTFIYYIAIGTIIGYVLRPKGTYAVKGLLVSTILIVHVVLIIIAADKYASAIRGVLH